MKAVLLAGGFGKRLDLKDIPKPMYQVAGKPLLEHNVLLLKKHNVKDICILIYHLPEAVKNYFGNGSKWNVNIQYSLEDKPLGTSGAVKNAEWFINKERFFIIYGDNYTNIDLSEMLDFHISQNAKVTIALFDPKEVLNSDIAGGVIKMTADNAIDSFTEGKGNAVEGYVNAGVYILEPDVLNMISGNISSDFGRDIFPGLISKGIIIKGYLTDSFVLAIDTEDALIRVKEIVQRREEIK